MSIEDISEYQTGILPKNAVKIETPQSIEEMMKKAAPIAAVLCVLMFVTMLCKTVMNKTVVISHVFILIGFCLGYICLVIHEWLHGIVYPRNALVTIGKITGKISFVALASYPLKRRRFIVMCLLPFVLGIIPLLIFIVSPADYRELNGLMFGMSCMGMVSPFPDVYNVFILCFSVMGSTQVFAAEAEVVEDENHNYVVGYIVAPVAYSEDGTVTADGVNLRKEPNTSSTILEKMYWGEQVIIDLDNSTMTFYAIKRVKTGTRGYASKDYIQINQYVR